MRPLEVDPQWEIHPAQLKQMLDAGDPFLLLDVRQLREWNAARVEPATLIPMNELAARLPEIADWKDRRVITLCHHGVRSLNAAAFLRRQGFLQTLSLAGGIEAYSLTADPAIPRY